MSMLPAFEPVLATVEAAAPQTKEIQIFSDHKRDDKLVSEGSNCLWGPCVLWTAVPLSHCALDDYCLKADTPQALARASSAASAEHGEPDSAN